MVRSGREVTAVEMAWQAGPTPRGGQHVGRVGCSSRGRMHV